MKKEKKTTEASKGKSKYSMKKKYTQASLTAVKKKYEENFRLLIAAMGTPEHAGYVKEEQRLNHKEIQISRSLNLYH